MNERNVQGALTFVGFAISVIAIFYFAVEYIPPLSDWSRVGALVLLAVSFGAFGVYIQSTTVGGPFFEGPRLRWLRPTVIFYLLAVASGIFAEIAFIAIDGIPVPLKVLASLLVGIGLVFAAAWRRRDVAP